MQSFINYTQKRQLLHFDPLNHSLHVETVEYEYYTSSYCN